ncbi:unnamed protein product [Rotaria sp. Silwood1]|nr:unnamed protein product [Rotaria sp. Silwood1]CAF4572729.1 unnamed protein product [Rotaria sp. Silwood1]CAF4586166.1 unnamed protein product [Rotaria sp. Silwood1]
MLLIISSFASSDVFDNGRQKYEQILSLSSSSSSSSTSSCWQKVLTMLQKYCSIDELDKYQSTIAYQFTLCHLSTMNDDLSNILCHRNNIELCVEELHQHMNAFIAYTEFYPFVQSVCYVLRQKSYQSELTSRLSVFLNNSQETITKLISSIHLQHQLTDRIKYQQYIQETIVNNAIKLKQLARTNMDKTQDILNNVIQAARHEYDLLKQICALSQTIQTIVRITCTYSFWFYALSMFTIYIMTIPKKTNRARSFLFCGMFIYVLLERYYQMSSIFNFYQWRLICWSCCLAVLIHFAYKYQSRKEIHNEQLCRLSDNLIQTEATFHRVSRELKRARSKSRSRSRSIRLRQREDKSIPPLIQDKTQSFDYDENKENMKQNHLIDDEDDQSFLNHTNKRHFSLLLPRSSEPTRILLGSKRINTNI